MKASIVDLRYNLPEALSALSRRKKVQLLDHGKPGERGKNHKVAEHPFFGMFSVDQEPIVEIMDQLRGGHRRG